MLTVSKTLLIAAALFGSTALVNAAPSDNIGAIESYQYQAVDAYAQGRFRFAPSAPAAPRRRPSIPKRKPCSNASSASTKHPRRKVAGGNASHFRLRSNHWFVEPPPKFGARGPKPLRAAGRGPRRLSRLGDCTATCPITDTTAV